MATLNGLMNAGVEELRIIQTILLLVTSTDVVRGKALTKVSLEWVGVVWAGLGTHKGESRVGGCGLGGAR